MYLILEKCDYSECYKATYTDSLVVVAGYMDQGDTKVYKLDSLTEVEHVVMEEIIKELS